MGACLRRESKIRRMVGERVCVTHTHTHNEMRKEKGEKQSDRAGW